MDFSKITSILGVEQLDEKAQEEVTNLLSEIVDLKAKDKAREMTKEITEPLVNEAREELIAEYEKKFDEYRETSISKFSTFVDKVLDEELQIPDHIVEWARKGELYEDVILALKTRIAVDEGTLEEEAKSLLKEAKEEITSLRDKVDVLTGENLTLSEDAKALASSLYLQKKCDGLNEAQKSTMLGLLSEEKDPKRIDERFEIILDHILNENKNEKALPAAKTPINEKKDEDEEGTVCVCPDCGKETTVTDGECSLYDCPDCEKVKLVSKEANEELKKQKKEKMNESEHVNGFAAFLNDAKTRLTKI